MVAFLGKVSAQCEGSSEIEPGTNVQQTGHRKPAGKSFPWHDVSIWSCKQFWQNVCEHEIHLGFCSVSMQIGHIVTLSSILFL